MYLHVKNLTTDVVVLDSASGLTLQRGESRVLQLTVAEIEALSPTLEAQQSRGNLGVFVTWDYAADLMWEPFLGGGGGGGASGFVIWRPNDPSPGSAVVTTWSDVVDQISASGGGIVFIDSTYAGVIDVSTWAVDLSRTWLVGVGASRPTLRFQGASVLTAPTFRAKNLSILINTTGNLLRATSGLSGTVHLVDCSVVPTAARLFSVEAGSGATQAILENSTIHTGSTEAFSVSAGEVLQLTAHGSILETDVFSGSGDVDLQYDAQSSVFNGQPSLSGNLTLLPLTKAEASFFDDSRVLPRLGDITAPARDTVQKALDFFKEDRVKDVTIGRDLSGQVTYVQRGTDPAIYFTRDLDGKVISMSDGIVEKVFVRNVDGQVTSVVVTVL